MPKTDESGEAGTKRTSPKIKVETIEEPTEETNVEVKEQPKETKKPSILEPGSVSNTSTKVEPEEKKVSEERTTPIGSFSQLDVDKMKTLDELDKSSMEGESSNKTPDEKKNDDNAVDDSDKKPDEGSDVSSDEIKEWLKEVKPDTTKDVEGKSRSGGKSVVLILLILLLVGVVGGGLYYFKTKTSTVTSSEGSETMTEEKETPTPSPTPEEVDFTKLKVNVLNGNGTPGEAGKVSDTLKELGFEDFTAGNAENYDFEKTTVSLKKDVPKAVYEKVKESLSSEYSVEMSETSLDDDSSYDVVIIVGAAKS